MSWPDKLYFFPAETLLCSLLFSGFIEVLCCVGCRDMRDSCVDATHDGVLLVRWMWWVLAWLSGLCAAQQLPRCLNWSEVIVTALAALLLLALACIGAKSRALRRTASRSVLTVKWRMGILSGAVLMSCCLSGFVWGAGMATWRMGDRLPLHLDNTVSWATFEVVGYPLQSGDGAQSRLRVKARVVDSEQSGYPEYVQLHWNRACLQGCPYMVMPGQYWRARLRWRIAQSPLNPYGMDAQARLLQQGLLVTASVQGNPQSLTIAERSWQSRVSGERLHIAQRMRVALSGLPWSGVLIALALGDQHDMPPEQRELFSRTGISHLVAISGTHVGLLAALLGGIVCLPVKRLRIRMNVEDPLANRISLMQWQPLQIIFVVVGVSGACVYSLLAGWGVPARRAFFGLLATAIFLVGRCRLSPQDGVALALWVVTLLDPWAVTSPGFWMSFGAVVVLIGYAAQRSTHPSVQHSWIHSEKTSVWKSMALKGWRASLALFKLQLVITLAMLPIVAMLFNAVSLVSVPANLWAMGWIGLLAIPMTLLLALLAWLPLPDSWLVIPALLAHGLVDIALMPVAWLATRSWAVLETPAAPIAIYVLSVLGVILALGLPAAIPRYLAWLLMLPQVFWKPAAPQPGGWRLVAFDIGQGSAILVQTTHHQVLFDTGGGRQGNTAASRYVLPQLRAMGITRLDDVVISHPDQDHIGGLSTVENAYPIGLLRGSGLKPRQYVACQSGQTWTYDDVAFTMLAPLSDCAMQQLTGLARNRCSCVLKVQGRWHSALLPGDIDSTVEKQLLGLTGSALDTKKTVTTSRPSRRHRNRRDFAGGDSGVQPKPSWVIDEKTDTHQRVGVVDVVFMAHHGSRTSSSQAWIDAVSATHAISQSGIHNPFGHPDPGVEQRWRERGAQVWSTARDGAIIVESSSDGLTLQKSRDVRKSYWHVQSPNELLDPGITKQAVPGGVAQSGLWLKGYGIFWETRLSKCTNCRASY